MSGGCIHKCVWACQTWHSSLTWVSVCLCGCDGRVCEQREVTGALQPDIHTLSVPGGPCLTGAWLRLLERISKLSRRWHPSPSKSSRQTLWVGRKLEPSEAFVGLTQLYAHYTASPLGGQGCWAGAPAGLCSASLSSCWVCPFSKTALRPQPPGIPV